MMAKTAHGRRLKSIGAILILAGLIFSACSLRLTYNYLDWIIPWYVDEYVSLTDDQENLFDRATVELLDWHRYAELPKYTEFIISIKDAQNGCTTPCLPCPPAHGRTS